MIFGGIDPATGTMHVLQGKTLRFEVRRRGRAMQTVVITGSPTGGQFQLVARGGTSAAIAWDATAAELQAILESVATVGVGNVRVTGGPGPDVSWSVEFVGRFAGGRVPAMTVAGVAFTGGSTPAVSCAVSSPGGPLFTGGSWTAECQLRADYADSAASALLTVPCTVSPLTGFISGTIDGTDTDALTVASGRYEIEAHNTVTGEDAQPLEGPWTLHRTVVRP